MTTEITAMILYIIWGYTIGQLLVVAIIYFKDWTYRKKLQNRLLDEIKQ